VPTFSDQDPVKEMDPLIKSKSQFLNRNQENKIQDPVIEIDPLRCKPWKYHNRDGSWLNKKRCHDLIHSIEKNGQLNPALVRSIVGDLKYDFELIYGVRRWFACLQIPNQKLLARVSQADDRTCIILMHAENADSKDISEFERACSFAQQMKTGIFKTQTEMALALGITQGLISRMIKSAELFNYDWIKTLFPDKLKIKIKPAYELVTLLKDSSKEKLIKQAGRQIENDTKAGQIIAPEKILKKLINAGKASFVPLVKKELILPLGENQTIYCKRDPSGRAVFVFDSAVCKIKKEDLIEALKKAIDQFIF